MTVVVRHEASCHDQLRFIHQASFWVTEEILLKQPPFVLKTEPKASQIGRTCSYKYRASRQ
jgi:hypothetical protein